MNIPNPIQHLLHPKQTHEVFLSLVLDRDGVAGAAWYVDPHGTPHGVGFANVDVGSDSWEERTHACDSAIATIEERVDESTRIQKVVLGLPAEYLTENGEIHPDVRAQIKRLTQTLDLTPIGFVSLPQALVYKLKKSEGMPPSVILLGFSNHHIVLSLYKVGTLVGQQMIDRDDNLSASVEQVLKHFKELEVLPSRILLYGLNATLVEEGKTELLKYPWPTKANFLHFPKFDVLVPEEIISSVSLAGASEMATTMVQEPEETVEVVEPETLGFQKEDILEEIEKNTQKFHLPVALPALKLPKIHLRGGVAITGALLGVLLVFGVINWILPRATVTVLALPQTLESPVTVTVDPTATIADSQNNIIPGTTREDEFSGEKTIAVSGSKKVGDPAKGGITIYNKSLTSKTLKKGSVLSTSGLTFTLDSDVQVASASESIGSITFGKATATITAQSIGPEGNLPAGTEFTFKDIPSSAAIGRNDSGLTGGTSREVTVVTRSDYDGFVKDLTEELVTQAKQKLATSITGSEKLIDATLKTTIKEKVFAQELDQEAKELSGKITITVSGVSYSNADLTSIFENAVRDKLQSGYALIKERIETSVQNVQVKKDGKITLTVKMSGSALPTIDNERVRQSIAGKRMKGAQEYLQRTAGVGGVEFRFRWMMIPNRLPINKNNISVTVAVQE